MEWSRNKYNDYYNYYMPWIEDKYLAWFGENKTSYSTKETLKTDITGSSPVNKVQSSVAEGVGGQFSEGGLFSPVGKAVSTEGFNRAEHAAPQAEEQQRSWTQAAKDGADSVGGGVTSGLGNVGGLVSGGSAGEEQEEIVTNRVVTSLN